MRKYLLLLVLVGSVLLITGCADKLGAIDLSGELPLTMSNDSWAYRIIGTNGFNFGLKDAQSRDRLSDYQGNLEFQKILHIGKTDYLFTNRFYDSGLFCDVTNRNTNQEVETLVKSNINFGSDWGSRLDNLDDKTQHRLWRNGASSSTFSDPDTGCEYIITSTYEISSSAERETDKNGDFVVYGGIYQYEDLWVKGDSDISIGTRRCLEAEQSIGKKKIKFYVLDWNLDGQFTEEDRVFCDYHGQFYDFGKTIRFTNSSDASKDNKYIIKLIAPTSTDKDYHLQVQLVELGIREKKS